MTADNRRTAAQLALNALDKLVGLVVQQVNKPNINYRGDPARFRELFDELHLDAAAAGVRLSFPWKSLDEVEGVMKARASGQGSYAVRKEAVLDAVRPLRAALETIADVTVLQLENRSWQLGEPLGSGGFGAVFEAIGSDLAAVAKLIPKQPGAQRELLFEDLADARNVVPILDRGEHEQNWVIVMPRASESLRDRLQTEGSLPLADALIVMRDVAEALQDLQGRAVHRDVKPDNVLLLNGRWCLADFGIARYAEASTAPDTRRFSLTPPYAAPEQWIHQRATSAADVYALGITIYEAITGERPFPGPATEDYREQHLHVTAAPLTAVPPALISLISECLYKAPEARPTSTQILARLANVPTTPASPGLAALQAASLAEVQRIASEDQAQAQNQSEQSRRDGLLAAATQSFDQLLTGLAEAIRGAAPAARIDRQGEELRIVLGAGTLVIDSFRRADDWAGYPFDVLATAKISVIQPANRMGYTGRSHSLWFADAQQERQYHWFETAFMAGMQPQTQDPFALPAAGEARGALAPGMTHYQVAWPFTALAPGDLNEWVSDWSMRLAKASTQDLELPSPMPERDPAGSWRRN